jgi:hypothetical protein
MRMEEMTSRMAISWSIMPGPGWGGEGGRVEPRGWWMGAGGRGIQPNQVKLVKKGASGRVAQRSAVTATQSRTAFRMRAGCCIGQEARLAPGGRKGERGGENFAGAESENEGARRGRMAEGEARDKVGQD